MNGYFNPLRRKFGVLTLVLACVFAAGWIRSFRKCEICSISPTKRLHVVMFSIGQRWRVRFYSERSPIVMVECTAKNRGQVKTMRFETLMDDEKSLDYRTFDSDYSWIGDGLRVSERHDNDNRTVVRMYPYWSLVIPQTLLSAWLLLSKSKKQKPTTETPV